MTPLGQGKIVVEFAPVSTGKPTNFVVTARDHMIWLTYEQVKESVERYDQMMAEYRQARLGG